jgi:hypothetical protein
VLTELPRHFRISIKHQPIVLSHTRLCFGSLVCSRHTTIADGLPGSANGFFETNCNGLQIAITLQMIWSMLSNAFLVSFFFTQMTKSETRSIQIIFSKKLCVNVIDGKVCVNIRCYDLVGFSFASFVFASDLLL